MENENHVHEDHLTFFEMFIKFWEEIAGLFKYIFNDVFLGIDP
jgi:hypothetical protein